MKLHVFNKGSKLKKNFITNVANKFEIFYSISTNAMTINVKQFLLTLFCSLGTNIYRYNDVNFKNSTEN